MQALAKQKVIHIPASGIPPVEPERKRLPLRIPMTPNNSDPSPAAPRERIGGVLSTSCAQSGKSTRQRENAL